MELDAATLLHIAEWHHRMAKNYRLLNLPSNLAKAAAHAESEQALRRMARRNTPPAASQEG